jgi:hypothetical protein
VQNNAGTANIFSNNNEALTLASQDHATS